MYRAAWITGIAFLAVAWTTAPVLAQQGPPFCRSGQGHPVHGWEWCVAKGWAPAPHYAAPWSGGWIEVVWEDVRFRDHRGARRYRDYRGARRYRDGRRSYRDEWMGRRGLTEVAGEVAVRRIEEYGRRAGLDARVRGRWVRGDFEGVALEVQVGRVPVAYLHDRYGDGRLDRVYMKPRRR